MNLFEIPNPNPYFVNAKSDYISKEISKVKSLATFNNRDSFDFWYGIISGFPLCCIDYYMNEWKDSIQDIVKEVITSHNNKLQASVQRTMCPECIINTLFDNENH